MANNEIRTRTVYCLTKRVPNENYNVYVGSTSTSLERRLGLHKSSAKQEKLGKPKVLRRMIKVGVENWKIVPLLTLDCTKDEIRSFERKWCELLEADLNTYSPFVSKEGTKEKQKEYDAKYLAANREEINERRRANRASNREEILEKEKAYRAENREKAQEYRKKHYEANREELIEKQRAYHAANREKILKKQRAYHAANREKILERKRAYNAENREKIREKQRAYNAKNREKIQEKQRAYRAAKKEESQEGKDG